MYDEAVNLYRSNNLRESLTVLYAIREKEPSFKDIPSLIKEIEERIDELVSKYSGEGDKLLADKKYTRAVEKYETAYSYNPGNKHVKDKMIECYLKLGENSYRNNLYSEAISHWEKILNIDPGNQIAIDYINTAKKKLGQ